MITRTLAGLVWCIHSPSSFELLSIQDDIDDPDVRVFVRFDGYDWLLQYWSPKGVNVGVPFATRDEAVEQVRRMAG